MEPLGDPLSNIKHQTQTPDPFAELVDWMELQEELHQSLVQRMRDMERRLEALERSGARRAGALDETDSRTNGG